MISMMSSSGSTRGGPRPEADRKKSEDKQQAVGHKLKPWREHNNKLFHEAIT